MEPPSGERTGQLLTKNATTGWRDWLHGELWLFPEGLLRVPIEVTKTFLLLGFIPVGSQHMRVFSANEFAILIANPRNVWIPANQIQTARLGHTFLADELRLTLSDQRSIHLLWLPSPRIYRLMRERLQAWELSENNT
jgi:hypothetical protein